MRRLFFFVPVGTPEAIDPGSAIISMDGDAAPGDLITVDVESNRHGYSNLGTYREKLLAAAGRHIERYPTRARLQILRSLLTPVGFVDYEDGRLVTFTVTERDALAAWVGDEIERL